MSNLSDFLGGGKPRRVTVLTAGSGNFIPLEANTRFTVELIGGGGSGGSGSSDTRPGAAAAVLVYSGVFTSTTAIPYVVGTGGSATTNLSGNPGTASTFGGMFAGGGQGRVSSGSSLGGQPFPLAFGSSGVDVTGSTTANAGVSIYGTAGSQMPGTGGVGGGATTGPGGNGRIVIVEY